MSIAGNRFSSNSSTSGAVQQDYSRTDWPNYTKARLDSNRLMQGFIVCYVNKDENAVV